LIESIVMNTPLTPIERCREIAGLAAHEMVVGVSPTEKHERLLAKYRRARRSCTVARAKIVADLRAAVKSGATGDAADLLIVLRRLLALGAPQASPRPASAARRSGAARLSVRTPLRAEAPSPARVTSGGAEVIPFQRSGVAPSSA
jgi:hypothetical protein